jgi:hypothetical protein
VANQAAGLVGLTALFGGACGASSSSSEIFICPMVCVLFVEVTVCEDVHTSKSRTLVIFPLKLVVHF